MQVAIQITGWQMFGLFAALVFMGLMLLAGVFLGGMLVFRTKKESYEPMFPRLEEPKAKAFNLPADEGLKDVQEAFQNALGPGAFNVPGEGVGAPDADSMPPAVRDASNRIDAMFSGQIMKERSAAADIGGDNE